MSVDPKKALTKNRVAIVRDLANADDVADELFSMGLFNEEMRAVVNQEPEKEKKNRHILDTLARRGKRATKGLHDAFLSTQNEELAELLAPYLRVIESDENRLCPSVWPPLEVEQKRMESEPVKKITDLKNPIFHEYNSDKVYKMRNRIRGKVFVINNVNFTCKKLRSRQGSDVDAKNISQLFEELQFGVERKDNLPGKEMVDFLKKERDKVNWDEMECLILVIMSHGDTTGVFGTDGDLINLKEMTELFTSANCPGLNEKPRLVFVQACRGENTEASVTGTGIQVSEQEGNQNNVTSQVQNLSLNSTDQEDSIESTDQMDAVGSNPTENKSFVQTVHSAGDFLIAYATPEGTPAYRNINVGSWFLNAIVWTFKYHADELEIQHLLLRVNELVSKGRTMGGNLTVSEVKSNLRKKFYFFPGVYDYPPKLINGCPTYLNIE